MTGFITLIVFGGIAFFGLGVVGFFLAIGARSRLEILEIANLRLTERIAKLEATSGVVQPAPEPLPEPAAEAVAPSPVEEPPVEEPPALPAEAAVEAVTEPAPPPVPPPVPAKPGKSLEELIGANWAVWVGGLALALGAILLVRYSIEQGFFGPGMRIAAAAIFSIALIAAGEWIRRRDRRPEVEAGPDATAYIPGVLTATGTVAAFGTIYAAYALYDFIGPAVAFGLLGIVGIACMVAAALHGPALAGLGLLGALITPMLVSSDTPNPWPVVIYIPVVVAAASGLARIRRWLWLALAATGGAGLWTLLMLMQKGAEFYHAALLHLVIEAVVASLVFAVLPHRHAPEETTPDTAASGVLGGWAVVAALVLLIGTATSFFGGSWIAGASILIAILGLTGAGIVPATGASVAAGLLLIVAVRLWPNALQDAALLLGPRNAFLELWPDPLDATGFGIFTGLATLALTAVTTARLHRSADRLSMVTTALYLGTALLTPLGVLVMTYLRMIGDESSPAFAVLAALVTIAFAVLAGRFQPQDADNDSETVRLCVAGFAAGAIAALALGCVFALSDGSLVVALAVAAAGTAYVSARLEVPVLRWCVTALGAAIAVRLAYDPRVAGMALGTTPILNWLLFGYGVPALAFALAARFLRRKDQPDDLPVHIADGLTVLFAGLLVFFEIHHAMTGGDPLARRSGLVEQGLFCLSGLGFGLILTRLDLARANPVFRIAALIASGLGLVTALIGLGITHNPLFSGEPVAGNGLFNTLMLGYLAPAAMAGVLAAWARATRPTWYWGGLAAASGLLLFAYISLEVRRLYQGEIIGVLRHTGEAEWWTYSAVWLVMGLMLLAYGIARQSREARIASAAFVLLTVVKVFLFDMAGLEGVLRALSFIGLGLALIGIGLVYQKLVFGGRGVRAPAETP